MIPPTIPLLLRFSSRYYLTHPLCLLPPTVSRPSTRSNTTSSLSDTSLNTSSKMSTFYDLKADLPKGEKLDFATLKGKVVLIVNTASAWYVVHLAIALAVV
jgi:hypothetical protein